MKNKAEQPTDILEHIMLGVVMFDSSGCLSVWNSQYEQIKQFPKGFLKVGLPYWDLALYLAQRGDFGEGDPEELTRDRRDLLWGGTTKRAEMTILNEFVYEVLFQRSANEDLIITYTDITDKKRAAEELLNSETHYQEVVNGQSELITRFTSDFKFTFINEAYCHFVGAKAEDLLGKSIFNDIPDDEILPLKSFFLRFSPDQSKHSIENSLRSSDGELRYFEWVDVATFNDDGTVSEFQSVARDITDRKIAEKALQQSEARFRDFANSTSDWFWESDADHRFTYLSERFLQITGGHAVSTYGKTRREVAVHPNDEKWTDHIACLEAQKPFRDFCYEYALIEGQSRWLSINGRPVYSADGEFKGYRGTGREVTEQIEAEQRAKHAEEELRQSEEQFRGAFETSAAGMALHTIDGTYLKVNQTFCDLLGYTEKEILQMNWRDVTHPDDITPTETLDQETESGERDNFTIEKRYTHKDGHIIWARVFSAHLRDPKGIPQFILGQIYDITELKKAEDALRDSELRLKTQVIDLKNSEERLEAQAADLVVLAKNLTEARDELQQLNDQKNKLFSIIAHDLRGPFTGLLGYSSMLSTNAEQFDPKLVAVSAATMHETAQRVFDLLENLLDWSRLQMEGAEVDLQPVKLSEIFKNNIALLSPVAEAKNIQLKTDGKQTGEVIADGNMLDTILRNMINNAIKFTHSGGSITLKTCSTNGWTNIKITDTGVGMPPDKVKRLFRLDQKTSSLGTQGEVGTGLGLNLCEELIKNQGGRIEVESKEGEGSTFHIYLPTAEN